MNTESSLSPQAREIILSECQTISDSFQMHAAHLEGGYSPKALAYAEYLDTMARVQAYAYNGRGAEARASFQVAYAAWQHMEKHRITHKGRDTVRDAHTEMGRAFGVIPVVSPADRRAKNAAETARTVPAERSPEAIRADRKARAEALANEPAGSSLPADPLAVPVPVAVPINGTARERRAAQAAEAAKS